VRLFFLRFFLFMLYALWCPCADEIYDMSPVMHTFGDQMFGMAQSKVRKKEVKGVNSCFPGSINFTEPGACELYA
jgi:hypothetical protein